MEKGSKRVRTFQKENTSVKTADIGTLLILNIDTKAEKKEQI